MQKVAARSAAAKTGLRGGLIGLAAGLCVLMANGSSNAASPTPLSPAWFAARGASTVGKSPSASAAAPQIQTLKNVQTSLQSLNAATLALRHAQAAQASVSAHTVNVPDGLTIGGLSLDTTAGPPTNATVIQAPSAAGPKQVTVTQTAPTAVINWTSFNVGANTTLTFDQSAGGASAQSWAALNRVTSSANPSVILGQIKAQGQVYIINPSGILFGAGSQVNLHALVAAAATLTDQQLQTNGLYGSTPTTPTFTAATGAIQVDAGASIVTDPPASATAAGGLVLLAGTSVTNRGAISTPDGQTVLAAGTDFLIQKGYSLALNGDGTTASTSNTTATVLGSIVVPVGKGAGSADPNAGQVLNTGLITATTGDITLAGNVINQAGVVLSTTSVSQRGTIHMISDVLASKTATDGTVTAYALDPASNIVLAPGSATLILNDTSGATSLESQRAASLAASVTANQLYASDVIAGITPALQYVRLPDVQSESRIEITSGGGVDFQPGSLTLATGGQLAVSAGAGGSSQPTAGLLAASAGAGPSAAGQILVEAGATLDVSGSLAAVLPIATNAISVQIEGFQLRDDPLNRDPKSLNNSTVSVDARQLVIVPASTSTTGNATSGYSVARAYTPGGVLEVSGELGNVGHTIDEYTASGGSITLSAATVATQSGATVNIAGGAITYQGGAVPQSWLISTTGQLYNVNTAPADISYVGVYSGQTFTEPRWNISRTYTNPLIAPSSYEEAGYIVGRDAGTFTVSAENAVLNGTINASVVAGANQNAARTSGLNDSFLQPQSAVPLGGLLALETIGNNPLNSTTTGLDSLPNATSVLISNTLVTAPTAGVTNISATALNNAQLGGVTIVASGGSGMTGPAIAIADPVTLGNGAVVNLVSPYTVIGANIVARGGSVSVSDTVVLGSADQLAPVLQLSTTSGQTTAAPLEQNEVLNAGVTIDTRGLWTNALLDRFDLAGEAYLNGGNVSFTSTRGIALGQGSLIDASAGGAITAAGKTIGGTGGSIAINGDTYAATNAGATPAAFIAANIGLPYPVTLDGTVRSVSAASCSTGCGFSLTAPAIAIGDGVVPASAAQVVLPTAFFASGFASYTLNGIGFGGTSMQANNGASVPFNDDAGQPLYGITVAPGAQVNVVQPTAQFTTASRNAPTGSDPAVALATGLLPLYGYNQQTAALTQRPAASLTLNSDFAYGGKPVGGEVNIGAGASITVDPGASVAVKAVGSIIVSGATTAADGTVTPGAKIIAPSGTISLVNDNYQAQSLTALTYVEGQVILVGSGATLDASSQPFTTLDSQGRPFGQVMPGGNILIGGPDVLLGSKATGQQATDAFVVISRGATLNASGGTAMIDPAAGAGAGSPATFSPFAGARATPSAGGLISLDSETGMILDGALLAQSGGAGALGGTLSIAAETPIYAVSLGGKSPSDVTSAVFVPNYLRTGRDLLLSQTSTSSGLTGLDNPAVAAAVLDPLVGQTNIGVDRIAAGGFSSVNLSTQDALVFEGNVSLSVNHSVAITVGALGETSNPTTTAPATVTINAPYVSLSGTGGEAIYNAANGAGVVSGAGTYALKSFGYVPSLSQPIANSSFTVSADQIDFQGYPAFGEDGALGLNAAGDTTLFTTGVTPAKTATTDIQDFSLVALRSSGDIRFLQGPVIQGATPFTLPTTLLTAGDITLAAQQVYPASNATAQIIAGASLTAAGVTAFQTTGALPSLVERQGALISIQSVGGSVPPVPADIEGSLTFIASTIDQGGIVRAPLGALSFGNSSNQNLTVLTGLSPFQVSSDPTQAVALTTPLTNTVVLLPGSVTSVSANGLTIADGGTTDGISYCTSSPCTAASSTQLITTQPTITLAGASFIQQAGAMLDLSGGGTLAGIGFITGSGGSVDTLATPTLTLANGGKQNSDKVYAIVAGAQPNVAQASLEGYAAPAVGQQITIPAGIPGLPAGTYTLLPADNALRPGGFRVELTSSHTLIPTPQASPDGSYAADVQTGIAGTTALSVTPVVATITPAASVTDHSQYDQETYSQFVTAQAALQGLPRSNQGVLIASGGFPAILPEDGGLLQLEFLSPATAATASALSVQGVTNFTPAPGGYGGQARVYDLAGSTIEITPPNTAPTAGTSIAVDSGSLNALGATALSIGVALEPSATLDQGATLSAPEVVFFGSTINGTITTIGQTGVLESSSSGLTFAFGNTIAGTPAGALLASNAVLQLTAAQAPANTITVGPAASLAAGGSLIFSANSLTLPTTAQYGAANLQLATNNLIVGTPPSGAQSVPNGVNLTSGTLATLLAGGTGGAPPLQSLTLTASNAIYLYGSIDIAAASLQQIEFNTPSIQGSSTGGVATIEAGRFVWNGLGATSTTTTVVSASAVAPTPVAGGAGGGNGSLVIAANTIILGYGDGEVPQYENVSLDRVLFGFSNVTLSASQAIVARDKGTLIAYQTGGLAATQSPSATKTAYSGTGGALTLDTPLLTAANGAILGITAGGPLSIQSSSGGSVASGLAGQGGEIDVTAPSVSVSNTIALPAGKLSLLAMSGDVNIASTAAISLAGVTTPLFDQALVSPGGSLVLESTTGNILAAAGSMIDVSAQAANAGSIQATALSGGVGVAFDGTLVGGSTGGTGGSLTIRTATLPQAAFDQLQTTLNGGGFTGARAIEIATGDVAVTGGAGAANQVRASTVSLTADAGSITVSGVIDASGATPGAISLAAGNNLAIAGSAVLDAHSTVLQTDSTGAAIDAENAPTINLTLATASKGTLSIGSGATLNVTSPETVTAAGIAPGVVTITVPRTTGATGNATLPVQIGNVAVPGAGTIDIQAFRAYTPTASATLTNSAGTMVTTPTISQTDFATWNTDSQAFINAVVSGGQFTASSGLATKLGSLVTGPALFAALHLRPGVEVDEKTGDLTVVGDVDLSGYRYASVNPNSQLNAKVYGSGEPGALAIRVTGNLTVQGSVTDGFNPPSATDGNPDDNGWVVTNFSSAVTLPLGAPATTLGGSYTAPAKSTTFPNSGALNFPIVIDQNTIKAGTVLPIDVTTSTGTVLKAGTVVPTGGVTTIGQGTTFPANTPLPANEAVTVPELAGNPSATTFTVPAGGLTYLTTGGKQAFIKAGTKLTAGPTSVYTLIKGLTYSFSFQIPTDQGQTWPAGASLSDFTSPVILEKPVTVGAGDVIPANSMLYTTSGASLNISLRSTVNGIQGLIYADATPLAQGTLSWSISAVAGANLTAANPIAVQATSVLAATGSGNLVLDDPHSGCPGNVCGQSSFSVIRTGTGDLSLVAGGNFSESSLFGVYTAGTMVTQSGATAIVSDAVTTAPTGNSLTKSNYANVASNEAFAYADGGNLLVAAQGNLSGLIQANAPTQNATQAPNDSAAVGQWLWRQGGAGAGGDASWGVNTGTYAPSYASGGSTTGSYVLTGFTGFGALGGGNVTIAAGGDAGLVSAPTSSSSTGLVVAVASSSYVGSNGVRQTTGGGNVSITIGGVLNPLAPTTSNGQIGTAANGTITDLRGVATIQAGAVGQLNGLDFGPASATAITGVPTTSIYSPTATTLTYATSLGGPALVPGDAQFVVSTRGDLALAGVGDATRVVQSGEPGANPLATSWFSLWTGATSVTLQSAGGNILPVAVDPASQYLNVAYSNAATPGSGYSNTSLNSATTGASASAGNFEFPSTLRVLADSGDILQAQGSGSSPTGIELAPAATGQLDLLAGGSIYSANIDMSGADPSITATIDNPAYYVAAGSGTATATNILLSLANAGTPVPLGFNQFPLFAYGFDIATPSLHANDNTPNHVYAGRDIAYAVVGQQVVPASKSSYISPGGSGSLNPTLEIAAKPVWLRAGGEVVALGSTLSGTTAAGTNRLTATQTGTVLLNTSPTSLSLVQAGQDIVQANATVYGPGTLEVSAGRQFYQGNAGTITSLGPIAAGTLATGQGAGIDVLAGTGAAGPAALAFASLYLDPANLADPTVPLQDQPGKVSATYQNALLAFMQARGYTGPASGALAAFDALDPAVRTPFLLSVLFDELSASGTEAADPTSRFYRSYVRGNGAIASLFPTLSSNVGDVTLFGASGIKTVNGGAIDIVVPGGQTELGVASQPASASSGVLTQGAGDIGIFSRGSVLLGQSRVFTTFGGGITIWSAQGDVNAGQGAKTTQVFTPPSISYDALGDITLSPTAPATGAGIATLSPVPGIPPGDVVLVAPQGTIDAGEAGIRSTGNVSLAAVTVLGASNIQAGGKTVGTPAAPPAGPPAVPPTPPTEKGATAGQSSSPGNTNNASAFISVDVCIGDGPNGSCPKKP
jgi:filamentous hemagglutinin family protein